MSIDLRDDHFLSDSHILAVKFNERLSLLQSESLLINSFYFNPGGF